jgi:hypothetical protein
MGRKGGLAMSGVRFLGIVSEGQIQAMPLTAGGKTIEAEGPTGPERVLSQQFIGMGVIEPAARVLELIELVQ